MSNKLKEVTFLTIKDLKNNEIVLPGEYSKTFEFNARDLKLDIDDQDVILKNIDQNTKQIDSIVKKTSDSLDTFHTSTKKAQTAIKNKDNKSLDEVNEELKEMQEQINFLQKELFSDALTGAYNRKWFSDYYLKDDKFLENGSLAFIDLDKFKIINDTYGHVIGDQVLKYLVKFLQKELKDENIHIMRYAGDEFIILFTEKISSIMNVKAKMDEVQEKLSNQKLKSSKIKALQFSFSYGLIEYKKSDEIDKILEEADSLMYENKQKSK